MFLENDCDFVKTRLPVTRRERLLLLANHLETVPDERFDMEYWGTRTACGTSYCVLGHATTIPEFRAQGLILDWGASGNYPLPRLGNYLGFGAGREFFGLTFMEADELFSPEPENTPNKTRAEKIAEIRALAEVA